MKTETFICCHCGQEHPLENRVMVGDDALVIVLLCLCLRRTATLPCIRLQNKAAIPSQVTPAAGIASLFYLAAASPTCLRLRQIRAGDASVS